MSTGLTKDIFPIGLLLEKRPCLIIGGGKTALRKVEALLAAKAVITVISPSLTGDVEALKHANKIKHIARAYKTGDTQGYHLVFAATGNRQINHMILQECRAASTPCCSVDGNWMQGDFVTPAVIRKDQLSVAISTGGQSCRRSRLIKENLTRHLDMVDALELIVIGTSHQQIDLSARDKLQIQNEDLLHVGDMLMQVWGLHAFMLLVTCNRIELLGIITPNAKTLAVLQRILTFDALCAQNVYIKKGQDAFTHTALLASGLLSQMTGETHIVAQIKDALAVATEKGWANGMLKEWIDTALHISRDIRATISYDESPNEIEDVAIAYTVKALGISEATAEPNITIVGAGTIGQGLVTRLADLKIPCNWVYYRNVPAQVPSGATLHPWNQLQDIVFQSDCVMTAVAAKEPILTETMAPRHAILLIDLGAPRNIDPALGTPPVKLVNMDDLQEWYAQKSNVWDMRMKQAENLVQEHQPMYQQIMRSFQN